MNMPYDHRQSGFLHLIILLPAITGVAFVFMTNLGLWPSLVILSVSGFLTLLAFSFKYLHIRDEGHVLAIRYGPIPFFSHRIPYGHITSVQTGRSSFIDGWGIHYLPGRGWIYNLWGFDCVILRLGTQIVRVGTDDVEGLILALKSKHLNLCEP